MTLKHRLISKAVLETIPNTLVRWGQFFLIKSLIFKVTESRSSIPSKAGCGSEGLVFSGEIGNKGIGMFGLKHEYVWQLFFLSFLRGHLVVWRKLDWGSPLDTRALGLLFSLDSLTHGHVWM